MRLLVVGSLVLLGFAAPASLAQEKKVVPAINKVEPWQQVGQQPYEFTWVQREQNPHTLEDFEDLTGWTLELFDGAQGELRRSREQQLWGEHVGKIQLLGRRRAQATSSRGHPNRSRFRAHLTPWICGATATAGAGSKDETTPPVDVSILIVDCAGKRVHDSDDRHPLETMVADSSQDSAGRAEADCVSRASYSGLADLQH